MRHPNVRVRAIGQNSAEVADEVREGRLEAGLVVLPVDDRGLEVRPAMREELLYVSADPERVREPMTIERLADAPLILYDARWGVDDPTRRQLRERAQQAGVQIEPQIEVEYGTAALDLCARGLGDTVTSESMIRTRSYAPQAHGRAVRSAAVRHVRVHHPPQRPPLARHARVHQARREARAGAAAADRGAVGLSPAAAPTVPPRRRRRIASVARGARPLRPSRRTNGGWWTARRSRSTARSTVGGQPVGARGRSAALVPVRQRVLLVVVQRGGDLAREHGRDRDAGAAQLVPQRLGEAALGRLRRAVARRPRERAAGRRRRRRSRRGHGARSTRCAERRVDRVDGPEPVDARHLPPCARRPGRGTARSARSRRSRPSRSSPPACSTKRATAVSTCSRSPTSARQRERARAELARQRVELPLGAREQPDGRPRAPRAPRRAPARCRARRRSPARASSRRSAWGGGYCSAAR